LNAVNGRKAPPGSGIDVAGSDGKTLLGLLDGLQ
jgi:hypothetical protein